MEAAAAAPPGHSPAPSSPGLPARRERGAGFWPTGGTKPVAVRRSFAEQHSNRASHPHIISPAAVSAQGPTRRSAPFGTDVDHASDTAGSRGRLKLLVDGGARCVEVRAKSTSAGADTHERPLAHRNVLTGHGVETHSASAHMTSTMSGGVDLSRLSLRKDKPGDGARKHLHADRNVLTGSGVTGGMLHTASGHLSGIGSGSHEAERGGLRKQAGRREAHAVDSGAAADSPPRNILLGHGVVNHHQSAHLVASASGGHKVYKESPAKRRDAHATSSSLLHHDPASPVHSHVTGWAAPSAGGSSTSRPQSGTGKRAGGGTYGGERPF